MFEITPTKGIIVLKEYEQSTESEGGIVLPKTAQKTPNSDKIGVVTHVGSDIEIVKVGDVVAFSHAYATAVNFGRENTRVFVKAENILGILT